MGHWAGSDHMTVVDTPRGSRDRPSMYSCHAVDDDSGEVACGAVAASHLTHLDRPWEKLPAGYKCRACLRAVP